MSFPFSSRSVGVLVRAIDQGYTDAMIGTLILEAGADQWQPSDWPNKQTRLQRLFASMRRADSEEAEEATLELVRLVLRHGAPTRRYGSRAIWWEEVVEAVAADGWEYDEERERLIPTVPGVRVAEETTKLEADLRGRGWGTSAGHYRQALASFADGRWASCNGQLRSLVEDLVPEVAESLTGKKPKELQAALDALRKRGFLVEGEFGIVNGMWQLFQHRGAHPGLSDEEEARYRLMTATAYCRFLLSRLPG